MPAKVRSVGEKYLGVIGRTALMVIALVRLRLLALNKICCMSRVSLSKRTLIWLSGAGFVPKGKA